MVKRIVVCRFPSLNLFWGRIANKLIGPLFLTLNYFEKINYFLMRNNLSAIITLLFCLSAKATLLVAQQDIPSVNDGLFCKPGVINSSPGKGLLVEYGSAPISALHSYNSDSGQKRRIDDDVEQLLVKLKVPLVYKPGLTMLLGFEHSWERHELELPTNAENILLETLDNQTLKISRAAFYLLKPLNDKFYFGLRAGASFNGDYEGLIQTDDRFGVYRVAGLFGFKKREDLELGLGVLYNNSFRKEMVVPFLLYNQTFNEKWGIESVLPVNIKGRYNFNKKSLLLLGAEYVSNVYSMDIETPLEPTIYNFKSSGLLFSLDWQQRFTSWTWVSVQGGYAHSFDAVFENTVTSGEVPITPAGGVFGRIGIFVSPPSE